jgi:hypothetical protein
MYRLSKPYRLNNRVARRRYGWWALPIGIAVLVGVEVFAFLNIVNWAVEIGMRLFGGQK